MTNHLLTISSVPAETVNSESQQIIASWKSTDKRTIPAANKNRAVIIPATIWTDGTEIGNITDKNLRVFILDGITDLAKSYLSTIVEESNWLRTEVPVEHFTLSSLLSWQQEQAALAGRINGEDIKKWVSSSVTVAAIKAEHGEKIASSLGDTFVKLAGPNHGITKDKATAILAKLWKEEDSNTLIGLKIQNRLTGIANKKQEANDLDSIL